MVLSDTTDKQGLIEDIERWCGMKDGTISGNTALKARFVNDINDTKFYIETLILNSQDEFDYDDSNHTDFPIVTTPLTTSRDYRLNVSERILKIKRFDITYDGSTYYKAQPIDSSQIETGLGNDTDIDSNFSIDNPHYDIKYGSWFLYPLATAEQVTAGAEALIEWTREGTQFDAATDDAVEPGFDRPFHSLISKMVAYEWIAINKPKNNVLLSALKNKIGDMDALTGQVGLLMKHYSHKQQDRDITLEGPNMLNYK